jgi:hypothetical protein
MSTDYNTIRHEVMARIDKLVVARNKLLSAAEDAAHAHLMVEQGMGGLQVTGLQG